MTETTVKQDHDDVVCNFCWRGHDTEGIAGKLHASHLKESTEKIISAHHKCMQYASDLTQYKFESFGGFMIDDVEKEILRGSKLKCSICKGEKGKGRKATGACCGCAVKSCRKTFHFPCAYEDSTAITKRLVVTKNKKNKRYILYRVFCSAAHEEAFRAGIKEELRARKELDDSSSDEKDDNDEVSFSKTFSPNSPVSLRQTTPTSVNGSMTSSSIKKSQIKDFSLEPKPCEQEHLSMVDSIADSQVTDDNNKKAASCGARQKLEFVPRGRRSSHILAPSEYSPIPEERSLLNESDSLEKLDSPRSIKDKQAIVVLEDCGSSDLSNVRGVLCSKNGSSDNTPSPSEVKKKLGSVEKGRRTKSSPTKHSMPTNHLESAQENAVVDGEQLNSGRMVAKLGTPNPAKKNGKNKVVQRKNMSFPRKLRVSPRSGVQPDTMLSVTAEVHAEAPMEELVSAALATEHDGESYAPSSGSLSSIGNAVAEDHYNVTSASFVTCSLNISQSPSSSSSSLGESIYMTGDASISRKRKTPETCGDSGDAAAAAGETPAKRRAENIVSDDRQSSRKVGVSPGKHTCAKQVLKLAKAQADAKDFEVPSSHRNSNAAMLIFPGDMAHFKMVKNQALEAAAAEFNTDISNFVVYDPLQELKSPHQLIFFIIDIIGFLKSGDMENLERLLFLDEFAKEKASTYNTQGQIFKVLSNESGRILEALWYSIEKTAANLSMLDSDNNCVAKVLHVEGKRMLAVCIPLNNSSKHICAKLKARMGLYRWKKNTGVEETFRHLGIEQRNHFAEVESLVLSSWLCEIADIREIVVLPEDQYLLDKAAIKINPALNFVQQSLQRWLADKYASLPEGACQDAVGKACPSTPLLVFQPVVFAVLNFQQYFQEVLSEFLKRNEVSRILALIPVTNLHSLTCEAISAMASSACAAAEFILGVSSAYDPNEYPTQLLLFDMQKFCFDDDMPHKVGSTTEDKDQSDKKIRGRRCKNRKTC